MFNNKNPFYLDVHLSSLRKNTVTKQVFNSIGDNNYKFQCLCKDVETYFKKEFEKEQGINSDNTERILNRQKLAIIGYADEVNYFKEKIREYIRANSLELEWYPEWYNNIIDAIFHENWGLAGIAPWKDMPNCSSAKIIGDRIYFLVDGKAKLQPQKISHDRIDQLRKALLLNTPKISLSQDYSDVYMPSGERIAIFYGDRVKKGQPSIVFRKYIVNNFTFEEQATRNTIPYEIIPMLKAMVKIGFNVAFVGPVRTAKTTFLCTYQSYENRDLEGVMIETDPEIPLHIIMPEAPIMQLLAEGEDCIAIKKEIRRSDADYLIMAEARDGYALDLAVEVANVGTSRCKLCYHLKFVEDFCYDVACKIHSLSGGNLNYHIVKVAKSYQYIFQFAQLADKSQKRLKGIYELRYDNTQNVISYHQICKYDHASDQWTFNFDIGIDKKEFAYEEERQAFNVFESELNKLASKYPMKGNNIIYPVYSKVGG